jgi:hypothetical protein
MNALFDAAEASRTTPLDAAYTLAKRRMADAGAELR